MRALLVAATAALLTFTAGTAQAATTYTGLHNVGAGSAFTSITTDDAIGTLAQSNILDWTISMRLGGVTRTMNPSNSAITFFLGSALSASATELVFDFDGSGLVYISDDADLGDNGFCLVSNAPGYSCYVPSAIAIKVEGDGAIAQPTGRYLLGSTASMAVPEPSAWLVLVAGFAAIGGAMRARTRPAHPTTA